MFKKHSQAKRTVVRILSIIIAIILIFVVTISIMIYLGKKKLVSNNNNISLPSDYVLNEGDTVVYNGEKFTINKNITSILLMGIDKENIDETLVHGNGGQADLLVLMVIDTLTGKINAIPISRDLMVDINVYSENGQYLGVSNKQICLSYAYGDGKHLSCENTVKSVSRLFYGLPINSYIAFDINTIKILNDAVGGVTITAENDIQLYDKFIEKGDSITLKGSYALKYIRGRDQTSIDANNERMSRQKNYMSAFFKQVLQSTKIDITTPIRLYDKVSKNAVTNLNVADISFLTKCILQNNKNTSLNYLSIKGKTVEGEKFAEFHHDRDELFKLVIETFYEVKK